MNNRRSFITGVKGTKLNNKEIEFLIKYKHWGIILFSRNLHNIKQIKTLTKHIRKIFRDKNYPIMIDQEGGRVNRLNKFISIDHLTSEYFGKLYIKDKRQFNLFFKLFIDKTSRILLDLGININTVPVLDLKYKGSSRIIGDRSYSNNPKIVSKIGNICIKHFSNNSIATVVKHIPGHGLAKVDSHHFTPTIDKSLNFLKKNDFWIVGLDNNSNTEIQTVPSDLKKVIILGSENKGIKKLLLENCDFRVKIRIKKSKFVDSLNVSNAAAISLFEFRKK